MAWIDRFEKLGRLLLWLTLSMVLVALPVAFAKRHRGEQKLAEALQKAEANLAEALKPKKPARLALGSMGAFLSSLNQSAATGHLWFTNVSPRSGVVCVHGVAGDPATRRVSTSLPACQEVGAYASAVHMTVMFAGGDLAEACGKTACPLTFTEAPTAEAEAPPLVRLPR
jgi:hypothetical protein